MAKRFGLGRELRIRKQKDISDLFAAGKKVDTPYFRLRFRYNGGDSSRICISVSKKIGSAPVRNRVKRLFREIFRLNRENIKPGMDIMVIGKKEAGPEGFVFLGKEFISALKRGNILKE